MSVDSSQRNWARLSNFMTSVDQIFPLLLQCLCAGGSRSVRSAATTPRSTPVCVGNMALKIAVIWMHGLGDRGSSWQDLQHEVRCATLTDPYSQRHAAPPPPPSPPLPSACRCHQSCDAYAEDMSRHHSILQVTINHLTRLFLFPSLPPTSANSLPPPTTADSTPRPFQVDIPRRSHRHGDVQRWRQEHQLVNPPPLTRTVTTTPWLCSLIPAVPIGGQCLEMTP